MLSIGQLLGPLAAMNGVYNLRIEFDVEDRAIKAHYTDRVGNPASTVLLFDDLERQINAQTPDPCNIPTNSRPNR